MLPIRDYLLPPGTLPDARLLLAARALRAFGDGYVCLLLPYYLTLLGYSAMEIGLLVTATLLGSGLMTLAIGFIAHRHSTRHLLLAASVLMAATGLMTSVFTDFWPLLIIAVIGTLNPAANDVTPFSPLEQTLLARAVSPQSRTALFARYSLIGALVAAIGALAAVCLAADRMNVLEDLARSVNLRQIMRFLDVDPRGGSMLGGRTVHNHLREHFGHSNLQDLFIPVAVVAADLVTGDEVSITRGPVVEAVRASMAIPGVFPPVKREGQLLVDGGVMTPVPVRAVRALSKAPVLAVNLQGDYLRRAEAGLPAGKRLVTPFRIGRAGLSLMMSHLARQSLMIDPPDLEIAPAIGHVDVRDFTKAHELIELGAASVAESWEQIAALL